MIVCPECAGSVGDHLRGCICATWERLVCDLLSIEFTAGMDPFEQLRARSAELDQLDAELAELSARPIFPGAKSS